MRCCTDACLAWLCAAALVCAAGCKPEAKPRPAKLVISGDTAGWITPCGCTSNQSGGLARRGTFVAQLGADADVLCADAGGAPAGNSPYHRLKFEAILRGEMAMGLAAHNLGGPELALGPEYLCEAGSRLKVPFISANARDAQGQPIAEPVRIAIAGGRRIALAGVVSPRYATRDVRIDEPRSSLLSLITLKKGQYDSLIVLAYLPDDELQELAAALPEADAVIGGPTRQSIPPRRVGPALLSSATNEGKFLVELSAAPGTSGWSARVVEMDGTFADAADQKANLRLYLDELQRRDFPADQTGLVPPLPPDRPRDYRVAGVEACRFCHEDEHKAWSAAKHSHAWESLTRTGSQVDPYCQQCHTTGYGLPGGFQSIAQGAQRIHVGCESCHGPSLAHVRTPKVRTAFVAKDQCTRCHDRENSPKFEYATYWVRMKHGPYQPSTRPSAQTRPEVDR